MFILKRFCLLVLLATVSACGGLGQGGPTNDNFIPQSNLLPPNDSQCSATIRAQFLSDSPAGIEFTEQNEIWYGYTWQENALYQIDVGDCPPPSVTEFNFETIFGGITPSQPSWPLPQNAAFYLGEIFLPATQRLYSNTRIEFDLIPFEYRLYFDSECKGVVKASMVFEEIAEGQWQLDAVLDYSLLYDPNGNSGSNNSSSSLITLGQNPFRQSGKNSQPPSALFQTEGVGIGACSPWP